MGLLENKTAIITGGSRGIGAAMVEKFVAEGARVIFTYHSSAKKAEELANSLNSNGEVAIPLQSDASSYDAAGELVTSAIDQFGQIDIVVNNAGITRDNLMLRMSEEQWNEVMENNLNSVFNLTKHVLRPMLRNRGGTIINVTSVVGITGNAGQANYAASKAGVIGFRKSIAKEVGSRNIRCNAIAPGFIETEMTEDLSEENKSVFLDAIPLKRMGTAEEVADMAVFLGSDRAKYVSGQVISVCGGMI